MLQSLRTTRLLQSIGIHLGTGLNADANPVGQQQVRLCIVNLTQGKLNHLSCKVLVRGISSGGGFPPTEESRLLYLAEWCSWHPVGRGQGGQLYGKPYAAHVTKTCQPHRSTELGRSILGHSHTQRKRTVKDLDSKRDLQCQSHHPA